MNTNQYTQKTLEALQAAQQLAVEYQHNALEPEHLLHALASQEQGLIPQLLQKLNVDPGSFAAAVAEKLSALPRVSGSGRDPDKVYISQATDKVLSAAAREAKAMKDEYVSVEHVFLGLLDEPTQNTTELFRAFGIAKDKFLQQLTAVRGNQRVTTDNPEDTYNALQKYGQDLVDLARKQKLDPVIGRDQEIRNVIRILSRKTKNLSLIHICIGAGVHGNGAANLQQAHFALCAGVLCTQSRARLHPQAVSYTHLYLPA